MPGLGSAPATKTFDDLFRAEKSVTVRLALVSDRGRGNSTTGPPLSAMVDRRAELTPLVFGLASRGHLIPPTGNAAVIPALDNYLILQVYFDTDGDLALVARRRIAPTTNWVQSERGAHFAPGQKGNAHLPAAGPPTANYLSSI